MKEFRLAVAIGLLVVAMQSGCAAIKGPLGQKTIPKRSSVMITPWLGQPATVPLSNGPVTLPEALLHPGVVAQRTGLNFAARKLEGQILAQQNFEDNCVVLVRGSEYWYFLDPLSVLDQYAGMILLKPDDKIYTLPFRQSRFFTARPATEFFIAKRALGKPDEKVLVKPRTREDQIDSTTVEAPETWWTMSVVTRLDGAQVHHLVLPAKWDISSPLAEPLSKVNAQIQVKARPDDFSCFFQPGDILEKTHLAQFVDRL